jgi:tetratricopeptide (TPR) repeat protein
VTPPGRISARAVRQAWRVDEDELAAAWARIDLYSAEEFRALVAGLVADAPPAVSAFERAGAYDSTGDPERAVPLYREALDAGLTGVRGRRAVIQLASSLRNLGRAGEAVTLLSAERDRTHDELDDAVAAFLALALADTGREREAVAVALAALAPHLPRYQRSLAAYADLLHP